eukprot:CAMPEP_0119545776 /NCGR_PEP_ID=MMETSP1352-20130426/433_1 /TAXON_ID=265584 /ORGANISM="Stauroneis constricta, Strain CCMP1120" /LENGTH=715 /DNA_ID=CAMNT_0007590375 /DNA_START=117 /DNA_END=2264 /DNA_ORIENTATION=-
MAARVACASVLLLSGTSTSSSSSMMASAFMIQTPKPTRVSPSSSTNQATLVADDMGMITSRSRTLNTPWTRTTPQHRHQEQEQLGEQPRRRRLPLAEEPLPDRRYWRRGTSSAHPNGQRITTELYNAIVTRSHPEEAQEDLGFGQYLECDWRDAWKSYESPADNPTLIDEATGFAEYTCDVEGQLPDDLEGVLYRNGPGKFGVGDERVQHVLDADGLVLRMEFPKKKGPFSRRKVKFTSRFVETEALKEEREADKILFRSAFGTGPAAFFDKDAKKGVNAEPQQRSWISKIFGNAFNMDIKNPANTQVVSHGGKLLALFEAGLPHAMDPTSLKTLGEETLGGTVHSGFPIKFGIDWLDDLTKGVFGGAAHTAHPASCPKTGNLVGWHYTNVLKDNSLELTFTEWAGESFAPIESGTYRVPDMAVPPHDMAMSDNFIMLKFNALKADQQNELLFGLKSPGESITMDGHAPATAWFFPRPTSEHQFEPFSVEVPPCFSVHFANSYEDPETGNFVTFFTGWPPSDRTDLLGAWSGYCPKFGDVPPTYLWRLEVDTKAKKTVSVEIAPGSENVCMELPAVHPNFATSKAENVFSLAGNVAGESTAPTGYTRLQVESGSKRTIPVGEKNEEVDAYWFGSRYFTDEPIIVPKKGGDPNDERDAYLLGMVKDAAKGKSFLSIFDLQNDLSHGPVCKVWTKSSIPHGLHGSFAESDSCTSIFT